jgi:hypothetical protein
VAGHARRGAIVLATFAASAGIAEAGLIFDVVSSSC